MRQETNNEMDLLLRRLGRQPDVFAPDAGDHLDADELSAYAENALPTSARTRYTEHLAECSRCRGLVVQLSASTGVVIVEQADKGSAISGWRKFLASLISPMVLRYAVPALGLIVVAVIGFVVLRRDRTSEYVSQVPNDQARPAGVAEHTEAGKDQPQTYDSVSKSADSTVNKVAQTKNQAPLSPTPVPEGTQAAGEENARPAKAPADKPESQPAVATAPAPQTAKLDSVNDERKQKNEDARKQEAEVTVAPKEVSKKDFGVGRTDNNKAEEPAAARSRVAKNKPVVGGLASSAGAAAPANRQRDGVDREEDSATETRTVAGRSFRKQRGIWVDTAYESSRATTNLTRGSEYYRSLIADEPPIKTIADQLDGEIIVVWKGKAYRIR